MFGILSFYTFFFVFLFIFLSALQHSKFEKKTICILCYVLLFILAGFRGVTVGGDLDNYLPEFELVSRANFFSEAFRLGYHEPGYVIFLRLLGVVSSDPHFFLLGTAFVSLIGPFYLFNKYSKDLLVSVLLYYAMGYYTNTFNNVRQALALSVIFMTLPFLFKKDFYKYLIGVLIATTFHYSAIVMLLLYPLTRKVLTLKNAIIYVGGGLVISYTFFYVILGTVSQYVLYKYDPDSIMENTEGSGYGLFAFYSLIFVFVSFYFFLHKKKWNDELRQTMSVFVILMLVTIIVQFTAPLFHSMTRMTQYCFIPFVTIGIPYIHSVIRNRTAKTGLYLVSFAWALYRMIFQVYALNPEIGSNGQNNIPYVFWDTIIF